MSDNLFDRLADLFRASGPVNWRLAREIAESAAGPAEPIDPWLDEEYRDLAATAARWLDSATPLDPLAASGTVRILDRRSWASGAADGLAPIAEPLAAALGATGPMPEVLQALGPALVGLQMGGMVGALSHRILGGFDIGLPPGRVEPPTYLVANVEQFAGEHALDHRQVRLWVAMQETTHAAAMAVPWVRERAVQRLQAYVASLEMDEAGIAERMEAFRDPESLQHLLDGGGSIPPLLVARGGDRELGDLRTLMAVVEGYAEFLIDRLVPSLIPARDEVRRAVDRRRAEPSPGEQLLGTMIGLDLEHAGYRAGSGFCHEVGRRWGDEAVHRLWERPETLPRDGDLADPVAWAARVLLDS